MILLLPLSLDLLHVQLGGLAGLNVFRRKLSLFLLQSGDRLLLLSQPLLQVRSLSEHILHFTFLAQHHRLLLHFLHVRVAKCLPPNEESPLCLPAVAIDLHAEGLFGSGDATSQHPRPEFGLHRHPGRIQPECCEASRLLVQFRHSRLRNHLPDVALERKQRLRISGLGRDKRKLADPLGLRVLDLLAFLLQLPLFGGYRLTDGPLQIVHLLFNGQYFLELRLAQILQLLGPNELLYLLGAILDQIHHMHPSRLLLFRE